MNSPTPAIVSKAAVRRLPRGALVMLCMVYILAGFIGRDAWKSEDITALGLMSQLASGAAHWLQPTLLGVAPENPALLPYWLGALAMQAGSAWIDPALSVRLVFTLLMALAMAGTWYGTYYLARSPRAQPVAFAFGGEAPPEDYARSIADGSLLALMACLGLAQLGHESTPALAQLGFASLLFFALATLHDRPVTASLSAALAVPGLSLSGAPALALFFLAGGAVIHLLDRNRDAEVDALDRNKLRSLSLLLAIGMFSAYLCWQWDLWRWKVEIPAATLAEFRGASELLIWFTWPAWPLAVWTVWSWRRQLLGRNFSRHIALPLWLVLVTVGSTLVTGSPDRTLLLGLPAMAALAAFALPTLKRQVASLIDWFTLLFFCGCGLIIWVVWIAMQTGFPAQPAANVERLAPGFEPHFSALAFVIALAATLVWAWLVHWRVGRHRAAIWKSLALPAGGAVLCWTLLMTLWLPLLNYTQSYNALVRHTLERIEPAGCVETLGLSRSKLAAFLFYGELKLQPMHYQAQCPWLIAEPMRDLSAPPWLDQSQWELMAQVSHPADGNATVLLFRRR